MFSNDPDSLGCFVQYRAAFYIAGGQDSLLNFFMLMDGYFQHRSKQLARATPFEVHIYPYVDVDLNGLAETMSYTPVTQHPQGRELPLKLFRARPVVGRKVLCFCSLKLRVTQSSQWSSPATLGISVMIWSG